MSTSFFDFPKISFRHRSKLFAAAKLLFMKVSRRLSRLFFSFVTLSRRSLSVSTGEGGHYAGGPRSSSFLWKVFCFFLIEGGRGTLWLAHKGFPFPPQTPPCPSQTRFILVNVTARRCRGFPKFVVPRRHGKGEPMARHCFWLPPVLLCTSPNDKAPLCRIPAQGALS